MFTLILTGKYRWQHCLLSISKLSFFLITFFYLLLHSILDKGLSLPRPEVVPFRLTANIIDAFGPTGAAGIYTGSLKATMETLRDNRDTLLSVLEPFVKDPVIDWRRYRSQQQNHVGLSASTVTTSKTASTEDKEDRTREAKKAIKVIDERLRGCYNLRNPNHKNIRRTDEYVVDLQQEDEITNIMPLSVEGQVHRMITEATNSENLLQLYVGWMPWV